MRRLTLGDCRAAVAQVLGVCVNDASVVLALNFAQERLLNRSTDPVGSWMRYKVCVTDSNCFALPRQVRHVKMWWVCNEPGTVRSEWFESLGYWNGGLGLRDGTSGCDGNTLIDRGTVCSFDNVRATQAEPRRIQVVATDASDNGKYITLRYIDSNGNRVYTSIDGVVQEGERLVLSTAGTLTSAGAATGKVASNGLYNVVKAVTNYPVRVYSWDVNSAAQDAQMAIYEPSETSPIYRSMYAPGFVDHGGCCGCVESDDEEEDDCDSTKAVTLAVRLQHIPVVVDMDPLVVGNLAALVYMVRADMMRRRNEVGLAQEAELMAAQEVDGELASYLGDGVIPVVRTPDVQTWGAGGVFNPVGGGYYGIGGW